MAQNPAAPPAPEPAAAGHLPPRSPHTTYTLIWEEPANSY